MKNQETGRPKRSETSKIQHQIQENNKLVMTDDNTGWPCEHVPSTPFLSLGEGESSVSGWRWRIIRPYRACLKIERGPTARLLALAGVGSVFTELCGDAQASPPWPPPKSNAAGPLSIIRQALNRVVVSLSSIPRKWKGNYRPVHCGPMKPITRLRTAKAPEGWRTPGRWRVVASRPAQGSWMDFGRLPVGKPALRGLVTEGE